MQNTSQLHAEIALSSLERFGRIGRRYPPVAASPRRAGRGADRTDNAPLRDGIEARALHAFAANGFGDAAIGRTEPHVLLSSVELYHRARAHRLYLLAEIVKATLKAVGDHVRRTVARWKRQQQARATYLALRALDARTLRDLGFDRSEILSVAAEVAGDADSTRARLVLTRQSQPF